ncbi:MAG TPA: LegC family aminotransferase [Bacteroidales bacterium]|nr:LegC family aminotransferase [Bacteroidales bacterium]
MKNTLWDDIISFVRDKYNKPEGLVPLHEPRFRGNERKYVLDCIDTTFVSSVGEYVGRFEEVIAAYTGSEYAVAVVNGTSALHLALKLAGVESGDEVITQPLTFIATANAIAYTGARPLFTDIDKDTLGLSPSCLEEFLEKNCHRGDGGYTYNNSTGRRIAACVPMHTFGHPCRIDELRAICDRYCIVLVEDAAESLGSFYKERHTGTFGHLGILSFNGNKIVTTGGGGMILTGDRIMAQHAKHLTTQAKVPHRWEYRHDETGYNYRLTNIQAALGCAQMEMITSFVESKRKLADSYRSFFASHGVEFFIEPAGATSNYWLNAILLSGRDERDAFLEYTNDRGLQTRPAWDLMTTLPMFSDCQSAPLPNAKYIADRLVNIPSSVI